MQQLALFLVLGLAAFGLSSCGTEESVQAPPVDVPVVGESMEISLPQEEIAEMWAAGQHSYYEIIGGVIDVDRGGVVRGFPSSWNHSREFSIEVPRGAVDWQGLGLGSSRIRFEIHVPIDMGVPYYPKPYFKLRPEGIPFRLPVTVRLHYPYWCMPFPSYLTHVMIMGINAQGPPLEYTIEAMTDELPISYFDGDEGEESEQNEFPGGSPIGYPGKF